MSANDLARVLAGQGPILLDFDGPVCNIFAGYPAADVAGELRALLRAKGIHLPHDVVNEPDPLEVLRWTGRRGVSDLTRTVEDTLRAAEIRAARSAAPTPYAREVIVAARQAGRAVAVVSNNSADAVSEYLAAHRLGGYVAPIVGRAYAEPDRMKPNPEPILNAISVLNSKPGKCVLIGDSLTDIVGAQAAGVPVVGYANKPMKVERFAQARANVIVTSMAEIARALVESMSACEEER